MTVHSNDESMGTVTGGGQYADGEHASIKATPKPGFRFDIWSDGRNQPNRTIVIHGDMDLTAIFVEDEPDEEPGEATLTVDTNLLFADNPTGGGTFVKGATTFVSAAAEVIDTESSETPVRYVFSSWSDGVKSRERNVVVNADMHLTAYYLEAEDESEEDSEPGSDSTTRVLLTVKTFQTTRGKVRIDDGEYGTSVEKIVPIGTSVTISAQPEGEFVFTRWSDDNTESERTIVVDDDITISAIFADPDLL